ncbi:MAG TPA: flagellar basal-body MS-ring/collar protein FliF [Candidatus Ozemobacteraceae bacterium]|nr:flagellar basal-body MS-ring/collar protein FliF [Candidatus Ozemobacteraceae bacterium]
MTEFLRQLWEPIAKLPRAQQIMLAGIVILVFAGIITATMWGSQKDFTPLFEEQLKLEDAGKVVAKLKELNIEYKLGATSSDIQVPLTDKSYILLQLAQEKTLPQARAGWSKLIDDRSMFAGTTKDEFELNFVRGLQDELESSLMRYDAVESAEVHITKPKKEVFKEDQKEPTAAVFLKLRPNKDLDRDKVRAIREWLSSAVEGLKPENIRITDTEAHDLTRLLDEDEDMTLDKVKSAQLKHTIEVEKRLEKKLRSQLEEAFGSGKASVRVTATMDFDQKEALAEVLIPPVEGATMGVIVSQKIENEAYEGKDLTKDGEPGVNSNLPPGAPAYPSTEGTTANKYQRNAAIQNVDYTRSKEKFVKEQGTIKRLSVSIILDGNSEKVPPSLEEQIRSVAQASVGFDKKRGDLLTLMVYPFNNDMAEKARRDMVERQHQERTMFMIVIGLLMAIPVMLGMVYIFVRMSRARAMVKEQEALVEATRAKEQLRQAEEMRKQKIREQQEMEWERRFQDINNFFPEIKELEEKRRKVQDLRQKAYSYAREQDVMPPDFDEMTPEEQYLFREAFKRKADGTLDDGLARIEALIGERERAHQAEMDKLAQEANVRAKLEDRVRQLVESKPEDAVQVLRIWLEEE